MNFVRREEEQAPKPAPLWQDVQWISPLVSMIVWASIAGWAVQTSPNPRYYNTYNPTISEATTHPFHDDTVSYPLLVGLSGAISVVVPVVLEFTFQHAVSRRQFYVTLVNVLLGAVEAVLLTIATTELIKFSVGYLRPNFASVCQPRLVNATYQCSVDSNKFEKSMVSFPSGHASTGTAAGWYATIYALWTIFHRPSSLTTRTTSICRQALFLPALAPFLFALGVSVTRVTDFKHHTVDVTMGTLLGLIFASLVFVRVVQTLPRPYHSDDSTA
ncbi:hypothetical protein H310_02199 [Aphanomyces invadans]|uniref:Phosphatidic acid phosphatase type 2/haloperoxidase domain-containing protein n=1 Tax=Aphanomyces invadans TaxID=157072 RepID=A0A024UQ31_9STRA|nr:hypothetical protein H310_02199 [Aphanomyces invadans]ETW07758.1 hypothetical protein H310_02199 [Aphanomyces invadans]|eukprot:XP_008863851.1 hypothetical protein H310_02199 [Aphanomyces invadans]